MNYWIHTVRGVRLVEGTLPRIAKALEKLCELLQKDEEEWEVCRAAKSPGPGWEPIQAVDAAHFAWRKRK